MGISYECYDNSTILIVKLYCSDSNLLYYHLSCSYSFVGFHPDHIGASWQVGGAVHLASRGIINGYHLIVVARSFIIVADFDYSCGVYAVYGDGVVGNGVVCDILSAFDD